MSDSTDIVFSPVSYTHLLIGKESDPLCKNITRLSGLAYDPEVYFNPEATAFSAEEISHFPVSYTHLIKGEFVRIEDFMEQADKELLEVSGDKLRKRMNGSDSFSPYMAGGFHAL